MNRVSFQVRGEGGRDSADRGAFIVLHVDCTPFPSRDTQVVKARLFQAFIGLPRQHLKWEGQC